MIFRNRFHRPFRSLALALALLPGALGAQAEIARNNVVVVIDGSGSMSSAMRSVNQDKMSAAKTALIEVLNHVPADTQIGLLAFGGGIASHNPWIFPLGPRDDATIREAIMAIKPRGGTPLGDYIKMGADRLLEERSKQHGYGTYRLLIVTDGEATDKWKVDQFTPEVIARGITVDAIGVDMQKAHTLATMVHSYRKADDPDTLKKAVADVFAEVAGPSSDASGADAFAEIAPLPIETASALIEALSDSGNHPIGSRPGSAPPSSRSDKNHNIGTPHPSSSSSSRRTMPKDPPWAAYGLGFMVALMFMMGMSGGNKKAYKR